MNTAYRIAKVASLLTLLGLSMSAVAAGREEVQSSSHKSAVAPQIVVANDVVQDATVTSSKPSARRAHMDNEAAGLIQGKRLKEGTNLLKTSPSGIGLIATVRNGRIVNATAQGRGDVRRLCADPAGAKQMRQSGSNTTGSSCWDRFSVCMHRCDDLPWYDELGCNLECEAEYIGCMAGKIYGVAVDKVQ